MFVLLPAFVALKENGAYMFVDLFPHTFMPLMKIGHT